MGMSILRIFVSILVLLGFNAVAIAQDKDFLVREFLKVTALDGSYPVAPARWAAKVVVTVSGPARALAPGDLIRREFEEISMASHVPVEFSESEPTMEIHFSPRFSVSPAENARLASLIEKPNIDEILEKLGRDPRPCHLRAKIVNGRTVGAFILVDASSEQASREHCLANSILAAFGFPLYIRMDRRIDSLFTKGPEGARILTATDQIFLSALYDKEESDPRRSIRSKLDRERNLR